MTEIRIGAEQFRRQLTDLLNRVSYGHEHVVIERHNTPLAALIPFEMYEALVVTPSNHGLAQTSTLTLEEVAIYLKLPIDTVAKSAAQGEIPGRCINDTWRFLKTAIDNWLSNINGKQVLLQQAGTFADDESMAELRRQIYQERGRPEVEGIDEDTA